MLVWLITVGSLAFAGEDNAEEPMSPANTMLFMSDHLATVGQPSTFHYDFQKSGTLEQGFTDTIAMTVTAVAPDGSKDVQLRYFTGERARDFPPVSQARGNPILLLFLQRDVGEMQRLTEGNWRYFQRVIKLAFANGADVKPVEFDFNGQNVKGTEIRITPYLNDSHAGLEKYNAKYYVFTLSEAVPGWIYQMRSVIPEKGAGSNRVLVEEVIKFRNVEPLAKR